MLFFSLREAKKIFFSGPARGGGNALVAESLKKNAASLTGQIIVFLMGPIATHFTRNFVSGSTTSETRIRIRALYKTETCSDQNPAESGSETIN